MSFFETLIPDGYDVRSSSQATFSPVSVVVAEIRLTTTSWLTNGLPRQFWLMNEKSRCSILFHLLVPGGKWHTEIRSPVSLASRCSSSFQSRTRDPLLPPPSAVISSLLAEGYCARPIESHHRRMLATAKAEVSWSVPTLTQPALRAMS